jgi:hypothetical protein
MPLSISTSSTATEVFLFRSFEIRHLVPGKAFFGPVLVPVSTLVKRVCLDCRNVMRGAAVIRKYSEAFRNLYGSSSSSFVGEFARNAG